VCRFTQISENPKQKQKTKTKTKKNNFYQQTNDNNQQSYLIIGDWRHWKVKSRSGLSDPCI